MENDGMYTIFSPRREDNYRLTWRGLSPAHRLTWRGLAPAPEAGRLLFTIRYHV